jgi:RNA polymerase sigma-70 factor (ECF subfamily)
VIHSTVTAAFPPRLIPVEKEGDASMGGLRRLTEALVRGEDAAWVEFNGTYGPALFRQLLALTRGDHALTEEALQLTYLRVAKHVRPCETEAMFKAWLRTVARTALQDCWRRQRSFADLLFRKWQEPPELADPANDNHLIEQLDQALFRLDPTDRALLEGKYYSNLAVRTLAGQLGITSKAAESRLTRAREALRRELLTALRQHE